MSKEVENLFRYAGVNYSHTKQLGMKKCSYMWKHHKTKKTGITEVWVDGVKQLFELCNAFTNEKWFYMPMTFK
jgi:hypothetical protein